MNHQTAAAVVNAVKLIKTGEVIELGHVLGDKMPSFGTRRFGVHIKRTFMNQPSNRSGSNEELVVSEIEQFDAFAHQTHENSWYNCFKVDENATRTGFLKLGVHAVGPARLRQLAGRGEPEPRPAAVAAGAPGRARRPRRASPREPEPRRARRKAGRPASHS